KKILLLPLSGLIAIATAAAPGDSASAPLYTSNTFTPSPGIPRDKNNAPTASYMDSQVQAQLRVDLDRDTDAVHFIRDNNDPRVITKTYLLKHAHPYAVRSLLRDAITTKRVDASYTGVETILFEDGTALLFVSAEEYRFKDHENGMGIDSLVARLDQPGMLNSSGQPKFVYFPANVPAATLMPMIEKVGMNVKDDEAELIGGKDKVKLDPDLNCLFFNTASYSRKNIEEMLRKYDVPLPEIKIKLNVYELYSENDDKLGVDFQAWKNNEGTDFFSVGGRFRDNWAATYGGTMARPQGSERTSFYNFNPKWNTRYLDFLTSKGKAKIAYSGEVTVRQNTTSTLSRTTQIFYTDTTVPPDDTQETIDNWFTRPLDNALQALGRESPGNDIRIGKDNQQNVTRAPQSFGFIMTVKAGSIAPEAAILQISLDNSSLIGYQSSGAPRIQKGNTIRNSVMVSTKRNEFVIGGLEKREVVRGSTGVPYLKDIPGLGYLFQVESESTRKSQLVVAAQCEYVYPESISPEEYDKLIRSIRTRTADAGGRNHYFFNQYLLDRQ
ncbi:type II secretion system protein GspD, partial [Victivallis vadensis]|uniref:type II secretion system protein GspD n=1 Tax=Victivallis vadensis TaxID=172901 RepID=UPI003AF5C161